MTVFLVFLAATGAVLVVQLLGRRSPRGAAPTALRYGLAVMFTMTGVTHFVVLRDDLVAMVPPALPAPEVLVTVTGVLELAAAAGLLLTRTTAWAAGGLVLLLIAVFPANVHAAASGATLAGEPATALGPRAAMQVVYIAAAWVVAAAFRRSALRPSELVRLVRSGLSSRRRRPTTTLAPRAGTDPGAGAGSRPRGSEAAADGPARHG